MSHPFTSSKPSQTRSERLRAERQQEGSPRPRYAERQKPARHSFLTREATDYGRPVHYVASNQGRRPIRYNSGTRGSELILGSISKEFLAERLPALLVLCAGLVLLAYFWNSPVFRDSSVSLSGAHRVTVKDVAPLVNPDHKPTFALDPQELQTRLSKSFPELRDIRVGLSFPARITISAVELTPVLAWQDSSEALWVDSSGDILPARGQAPTMVSVRADGAPPLSVAPAADSESAVDPRLAVPPPTTEQLAGQKMDPSLVSALLQLASALPAGTALVYTQSGGVGWTAPEGWDVFLGNDLHQLDLQLREYQALVAQLAQKGIHPKQIVLRDVQAPYLVME